MDNFWAKAKFIKNPLANTHKSNTLFDHCIFLNNLSYYFLWTSLKIQVAKGILIVKTNGIQKILAMSLNSFCMLHIILEWRPNYSKIDIKKNPLVLFEVASNGIITAYPFVFFYMFWYKAEAFKNIIQNAALCYYVPYKSIGTMKKLFLILCVFLHLSYNQSYYILYYVTIDNFDGMNTYSDAFLYSTFSQNSIFAENFHLRFGAGVVYLLSCFSHSLISTCVEMTIFILSWIVFTTVRQAITYALSRNKNHSHALIEAVSSYGNAAKLITSVNEFLSPFTLLLFLGIVSFLTDFMIRILDPGTKLLFLLYVSWYLIMQMTFLCVAAEINKNMMKLKDYISELIVISPLSANENLKIQAQISSTVGLNGYAFFTISYSFLGMTLGTIITFVIIRLQFVQASHQ